MCRIRPARRAPLDRHGALHGLQLRYSSILKLKLASLTSGREELTASESIRFRRRTAIRPPAARAAGGASLRLALAGWPRVTVGGPAASERVLIENEGRWRCG